VPQDHRVPRRQDRGRAWTYAGRRCGPGWTQEGGDLWEVLARLEDDGCPRYVVTDVTKDGTLRGPNVELLREVCSPHRQARHRLRRRLFPGDLRTLATLVPDGVEGAIVGKALYAQAFTLEEALESVR
jgi:Phosphoribosylformimino-5-aminoimidazole carboxamide ribonucleotide (ProFAR) isomerase